MLMCWMNLCPKFCPKIGFHDKVPWKSEKKVQINHIQTDIYHLVKKIMKIGPVDPEVIGLQKIVKNIQRMKLIRAKCIAVLASLLNGLNNDSCFLKSDLLSNVIEVLLYVIMSGLSKEWHNNSHRRDCPNITQTCQTHVETSWLDSPGELCHCQASRNQLRT